MYHYHLTLKEAFTFLSSSLPQASSLLFSRIECHHHPSHSFLLSSLLCLTYYSSFVCFVERSPKIQGVGYLVFHSFLAFFCFSFSYISHEFNRYLIASRMYERSFSLSTSFFLSSRLFSGICRVLQDALSISDLSGKHDFFFFNECLPAIFIHF